MSHDRNRRWAAVSADMRDHYLIGMQAPPKRPADTKRHAQTPFVAWMDLILSAAFEEHTVRVAGRSVVLGRGEFLAGRAHWAKRWNWGEQAVRGFFTQLAAEKMIAFCNQPGNQTVSVAKICNYDVFQSRPKTRQPATQPPSNQTPTRQQPHTTRDTRDTSSKSVAHGRGDGANETSQASVIEAALADYNRAAEMLGFSRCSTPTETRTKALGKRLLDLGGGDLERGARRFREALTAIPHWRFLAGRELPRQGRSPFRLGLDRLLSTGSGLGDVLGKLCDLHDEHGPANLANSGAGRKDRTSASMSAWDEAQAEELAGQRARFGCEATVCEEGLLDAVH